MLPTCGPLPVDDDELVALADDPDHQPGGLLGVLDLLLLQAALVLTEQGVPAEGDQGQASVHGRPFRSVSSELGQDVFQVRVADLLQLVVHVQHRLLGLEQAVEVDGVPLTIRSQSMFSIVAASSRIAFAVAHGRQDLLQVVVFSKVALMLPRRPAGGRRSSPREALGGHEAGAVAHAAVRDGRAVLDDQDLLALDLVAVLQEEGGIGLDDDGEGLTFFWLARTVATPSAVAESILLRR